MNLQTMAGIAASIFTAVSMLPQLVKLMKEKKAENISIVMIIILLTGLLLWACYGYLKKDYFIIFSSGFSLAVNVALLVMALKFKRNNESF